MYDEKKAISQKGFCISDYVHELACMPIGIYKKALLNIQLKYSTLMLVN